LVFQAGTQADLAKGAFVFVEAVETQVITLREVIERLTSTRNNGESQPSMIRSDELT
jgi:hypothetical protein